MGKIFFVFVALFFLVVVSLLVFAQIGSAEVDTPELNDSESESSLEGIPNSIYQYVLDVAEKKGILPTDVSLVKKVDFESLPKDIDIRNVGDTNLAIYEISYDDGGIEDQIYVITYSVEELETQSDIIIGQDKRQFLNFGFAGKMSNSGFLKTATNVETSLEKGYVMTRPGSITAVSTNLEVLKAAEGSYIEVIVYVNGERFRFGNLISAESSGIKKDYDVQSKGIVNFNAGDVISVKLVGEGDTSWGDIITLVEITTTN